MKLAVYFMVAVMVSALLVTGCGRDGVDTEPADTVDDQGTEDVQPSEPVDTIDDSADDTETVDDSADEDGSDTTNTTEDETETEDETDEGTSAEDEDVDEDSAAELDPSEPYVVKITEGVYFDPREPTVKVGQEVVFVNQPVDGKKDKYWTLVGDSQDFFSSEVLGPYDQFSHIYAESGVYTIKISPGGAGKIYVEE